MAVAKEIESRKEEFEEELLSIERKLSVDQEHSRNGGGGDIRERLGKVKNLDNSLDADEDEEEEGRGFMSDRRVVERDRDNESNGTDLRMTLKNDLAERIGKKKDDKEGRQVIVKDEAELEERRKRKEEEKQKEEERRIRHEEDKRRDEKKRIESSQNGTEKETAAESPTVKAEPPAKRKLPARDSSSDSDEKSKRFE